MWTPKRLRIEAPISAGELIDKITILEIKSVRIGDPVKRENVAKELALLREVRNTAGLDTPQIDALADDLRVINGKLWDIEDEIRDCEERGDFGAKFIELARSVYRTNDHRSRIKQRIDLACGSDIAEQKSHKGM
jgi:hypothetical protein